MQDRLERIESVKAGSLGGIAAGIAYGALVALDRFTIDRHSSTLTSLALAVAIASVSGFLFGITYRYIIRADRNNHLNSGAVLAFGLVRGLARVNIHDLELTQLALNGLILAESISIFAIARYTLDYALTVRWISPFESSQSDDNLQQETMNKNELEVTEKSIR
jgi:hypothetical protein